VDAIVLRTSFRGAIPMLQMDKSMNAYPSSSQVTQKNSPSVYKQTKSSRSIKFPLRGKTQHDTTPASGLCNGIIVDFMDGLVCIYPRHDSDRRRKRAQARSAARLRLGAAHDHLCARRHHASAIDGGDSIGKGAKPRSAKNGIEACSNMVTPHRGH